MRKMYCPYCGQPLEDGCRCEQEAAEEAAERMEEAEDRFLRTAYQQDIIDMYRRERR